MYNYRLLEVDFKDNYSMCIKVQADYDWTIPDVSDFVQDIIVREHGEVVRILPISEEDAKKFYDLSNISNWKTLTVDGFDMEKKLKLEYEKYKLQWMIEHNYTIPDLLDKLQMLFDSCNKNPVLSFQKVFESWERTEEGFEHDLYPNYKTWLETIALKGKMISIPAIEEAYFRGILKIVPDNLMSSPICEIGSHQFYFTNTDDNNNGIIPEYRNYLKNTLLSDIFNQIFNTLCKIEHADHEEFIYYYLYLEDKLGKV